MTQEPHLPTTLADGVLLGFVGWAQPESADTATAYEDRVLALLADHGARVVFRGRRTPHEDPTLPLEMHLLWFPGEQALAAYFADERRQHLIDEYGEVFTEKTVVRLHDITPP